MLGVTGFRGSTPIIATEVSLVPETFKSKARVGCAHCLDWGF